MSDIPARVREVMAAVKNVHVLATVDSQNRPQMRWMGALVEDLETPWTFYLVCGKSSRKMQQIAGNSNAQLLFSKEDDWTVATLIGTATTVDTPELRQWLWEAIPEMNRYYSGPDDPAMGIIKFETKSLELLALSESEAPQCVEL